MKTGPAPRWRWLALLSALALSACSSGGQNTYSGYFRLLGEAWRQQFTNGKITRAQAASIPYASMGWRLNGGREQIIVLATDTGGDLLWTAANKIVLMTHDGRLRRTLGLPHDLNGTTGAPPALSEALKSPFSSTRQVDFPESKIYSLELGCRATARARQTIKILGTAFATTLVEEDCRAIANNWSFKDRFWLDSDGAVIKSLQHIHPRGDTVQTEIFRRPS